MYAHKYNSSYGHKLLAEVSRVHVLVPLKTHRVEEADVQCLALMWCSSSERKLPAEVSSSSLDIRNCQISGQKPSSCFKVRC
ncbi:hypothetical protein TNCV_3314401 [Trichonephila clavipes]|nr:hypothetical protein TNCV_3314401 [Trichonephila clavipes]